VAKLKAASEEQVAQLPGIGIKLAKVIVEYLAGSATTREPSMVSGIDMATGEILDSRG
jgi:DNA uptake protein ComE-like DNA-binding protein